MNAHLKNVPQHLLNAPFTLAEYMAAYPELVKFEAQFLVEEAIKAGHVQKLEDDLFCFVTTFDLKAPNKAKKPAFRILPANVTHTPGPWHYGENGLVYHLTEEGECRHVARVCSGASDGELERRQNMANAALLVTAPELLAALEAVLPLLPTGNLKACDDARLAVARAKGEA